MGGLLKIVVEVAKWAIAIGIADVGVGEIQEYVESQYGDEHAEVKKEATSLTARILGIVGDEVLWPTHTRGAKKGERISPEYLTIKMSDGRAWFSGSYRSAKSVDAGFKRGLRAGAKGKLREMAQESEVRQG